MMRDEKEGPAARAFRLKVEYVEEIAARPPASRVSVPMTLKEFVAWTDPDRGLTSWSSFSVASVNGPYPELRRRLRVAWTTLAKSAGSGAARREGREQSHQLALREVAALAAQNAVLVVQKQELARELARKLEVIQMLSERERELLSLLNTVLPAERRLKPTAPV